MTQGKADAAETRFARPWADRRIRGDRAEWPTLLPAECSVDPGAGDRARESVFPRATVGVLSISTRVGFALANRYSIVNSWPFPAAKMALAANGEITNP